MTTERHTPLTDLESDALAELANVAMARASVSLRTMIQHEVLLSVPTVEILAPKEAIARVAKPGNPNLVAVRQDFSGVTRSVVIGGAFSATVEGDDDSICSKVKCQRP